jgi:CO/xanthine dehydrogenase Mo-binding subunit
MTEYHVINGRAPRLDAPDKATGRAMYVDDIKLPGMLYGALLQSPLAHAKILNIDTSKSPKTAGRQIGGDRGRSGDGALRCESRAI